MSQHYQQRKKANEKYLSGQDRITIRVSKEFGLKDAIQTHAESNAESVQAFIIRAITEAMARDNSCVEIVEAESNVKSKPENKLNGKKAYITDKESIYFNEWGIIDHFDGECYHVRIANTKTGSVIFNRNQFKVPRIKE